MKGIFFLLLLALSPLGHSRDQELMKCLGAEEKRLHAQKDVSPIYDLNQRLIAEMLQIPHATIQRDAFTEICSKSNSESWKLLHLSIKQGNRLFVIPPEITGMQRQMTIGMIEDYGDATKEILLNVLAQIQALSPTPTCLKEEIPELENFLIEVKYLQEDVDINTIFKGKDQVLFEKLKDYRKSFAHCRARLKKKPKSKSKAAPKKS